MKKLSTSDLVDRAMERAEIEQIRSTGNLLLQTFEVITGESITGIPESDRDLLSDLVGAHESENY